MLAINDKYGHALNDKLKNTSTTPTCIETGSNTWAISVNDIINSTQNTQFNIGTFNDNIVMCYPSLLVSETKNKKKIKHIHKNVKGKRLKRGDVVQKPFYLNHSKPW